MDVGKRECLAFVLVVKGEVIGWVQGEGRRYLVMGGRRGSDAQCDSYVLLRHYTRYHYNRMLREAVVMYDEKMSEGVFQFHLQVEKIAGVALCMLLRIMMAARYA